ncbi:MAG: glucose-6-phosphate dehydrogenase assembly protein OpcA [Parachlamydiaceae bacterium]
MAQQLTDIKIPNIEKELSVSATLFKDSATSPKSCLFTLIIFARETRRVNYMQDFINTILDKFPCRIIFIQGDDQSASSYCHVNVSSVISGKSSGSVESTVVCDQIVIQASQDQFFRIPFIVTPHIVPDLPVYLLWGQNPFDETEIFPHLQTYASRVIFDSECSDDLSLFCQEMRENLNALNMDIMDVSWALISSWRDVLTQLFDTPEKIKQLCSIKSVVIRYNGCTTDTMLHPEIRALYLQAWLACRLQWKYNKIEHLNNTIIIGYSSRLHPSVVAVVPETHPELPPGAINAIEITLLDGQSYLLMRKPNTSQALIHVSSRETCELPFTLSLPNVHKGMTFMREIFFSKLGEHYSQMLNVLSEIELNKGQ